MSDENADWPNVDILTDEQINSLKEDEWEKLTAAQETHGQVSSSRSSTPRPDRADEHGGAWVPGLILIAVGAYLLLANLTGFHLNNWWAVFILVPALGSFGKAASRYRAAGRITREVWGAISAGAVLLLVASTFLFGLSWSIIWPIFLIIGGGGIILAARAGE